LSLAPSETRFRFEVQQYAEKVFTDIVINVQSVPSNRELLLNPPRLELVIRGGVDLLATMSGKDIRADLDYRTILADASGAVEARVTVPPGVQIVARRPERVRYIIRKRAYSTSGE
jgi:hypothetical protein